MVSVEAVAVGGVHVIASPVEVETTPVIVGAASAAAESVLMAPSVVTGVPVPTPLVEVTAMV
jgi:hypothetical protein